MLPPINFMQWIAEHRELLKPPVCNKVVYKDTDFIIMVVGGPNVRSDFHVNQTEEFFYQIEGEMNLRIFDEGIIKDTPIKAGEIFLLPAGMPHSPQRFEDSVGLVIERKRPGTKDALQWYCEQCFQVLYQEEFELQDITKDMPPVFERFYGNQEHQKCNKCGWVLEDSKTQ